ncbi:hypothetical protein GY45DRAFT_1436497 [Cubamyces sp. BRFM 1775]|nr:hypothetical protein GY45DRAFT_1436497 [Cubamyces sp. BRFM 1775]
MSDLLVQSSRALRLPPELLHIICSYLRRPDLPVFALVNKSCNEICTPLLYRDIRIFEQWAAVRLVRTLCSPGLSFGRRLSTLIRTFWISDTSRVVGRGATGDQLDHLINKSIAHMSNLETLRYRSERPGWRTFLALISRPHPRLRSLDITIWVHDGILVNVQKACTVLETIPLPLPQLTELAVFAYHVVPHGILSIIGKILSSRCNAITKLSFICFGEVDLSPISPALAYLPALRHLEVKVNQLSAPEIQQMSHVKSISIHEKFLSFVAPDISLQPSQWPTLEVLVCHPEMVPLFLPENASPEHRRPIHTLQINAVTYERNWGEVVVDYTPDWSDTLAAVAHTSFSASPLKHLSFQTYDLKPRHLRRLAPYLGNLESLVVAVTHKAAAAHVFALGEIVVATSPRLHTLLLSDGAHKVYGQNEAFSFARNLDMQKQWLIEYSRHSSVLRRVAFTTEFEWEKGDDGAWYPSELPRDKPVEHPEGDDDEVDGDDETDSHGSISDYGLSDGDGEEEEEDADGDDDNNDSDGDSNDDNGDEDEMQI